MAQFPDRDERLALDSGCRRCPTLAESRTRIAWGNGPDDAEVVVVGEAPGAGDSTADRWQGGNHTGLAYTSRHSGQRIRRLMATLDLADRTYYTNAVKCFPADGTGSNREPTAEELANCRSHLETELERIDPAVVVATGKHATTSVLAFERRELDGFLDAVLDAIECPTLGVTLIPVLHPSYQDVWLSRLGYDEAEYRRELAARLRECNVDVDG